MTLCIARREGPDIKLVSDSRVSLGPAGAAKITDHSVHYLRGKLDLNGHDFDQSNGLVPNFPLLNLT